VNGDEEQLVRFLRDDYPLLVAALGLVCGSQAAAEDAVQEALAKAIVTQRLGRQIDSMPAWIRVVALNLLRNRWRSLLREQRATRRLEETTRRSQDAGLEGESDMDIRRAVGSLPRRQREAVALYYRLDLSVTDTAAAMGVTEGTVKTLLSRARISLGARLTDPEDTRA
jgi:RNA polymerase sigma-70 factor (ECF subfamily)